MERPSDGPMLIDGLTADLGGPRTAAFLGKVARVIDFQALADSIRLEVAPDQPRGGRPFWPVVLMVKCLLLAKWYGLSDPQLEEQLRDRLSFRRFVGLGLSESTPDETTFVNFRKRLRETGHGSTLFDAVLEQLRGKGLVLEEGSLVDATIVHELTHYLHGFSSPIEQKFRTAHAGGVVVKELKKRGFTISPSLAMAL